MLYRQPVVEFRGHRALTRPMANWRMEEAWCSWAPSYIMKRRDPQARPLEECLQAFDDLMAAWRKSDSFKHLFKVFSTLSIPSNIDKIICFGLGSVTAYSNLPTYRARPVEELVTGTGPRGVHHHLAILLASILQERFGSRVQLYAQDPGYYDTDVEVLTRNGFRIVGQYGAEGYAMIDERTLVFSWFCEVNTREVIADLARPAVIIVNEDSSRRGHKTDLASRIRSLDYEIPASFIDLDNGLKYPTRYVVLLIIV